MERLGKTVIIVGILVVVAGIVILLLGDKLRWLGKLPGDIRVERENFRFYMPVTTMILISIVASAILWLVRQFIK